MSRFALPSERPEKKKIRRMYVFWGSRRSSLFVSYVSYISHNLYFSVSISVASAKYFAKRTYWCSNVLHGLTGSGITFDVFEVNVNISPNRCQKLHHFLNFLRGKKRKAPLSSMNKKSKIICYFFTNCIVWETSYVWWLEFNESKNITYRFTHTDEPRNSTLQGTDWFHALLRECLITILLHS